MSPETRSKLETAIVDAGGFQAVAMRITESHQYVYPALIHGWLARQVPSKWVLALEQALNGKVSRYEMRPDVFGPSIGGEPNDRAGNS